MDQHAPPAKSRRRETWIDGEKLRAAREAADFTQAQLAAEIGVATQTIGYWEAGNKDRPCLLETTLLIALALDTEPADLMPEKAREKFARLIAGALSTSAA